MILFGLSAALMISAALAAALFVFLFPRPLPRGDARRENIAAARARLLDLRAGEEFSAEDAAECELEIKTLLLEEADGEETAPPVFSPRADKTGAAIVFAAIVPGALALYLYLGTPFAAVAPSVADNGLQRHISEKVVALQAHIAENPNDEEALALMGRVMTVLGREDEAAKYLARAAKIAAENADKKSGNENNETDKIENGETKKTGEGVMEKIEEGEKYGN